MRKVMFTVISLPVIGASSAALAADPVPSDAAQLAAYREILRDYCAEKLAQGRDIPACHLILPAAVVAPVAATQLPPTAAAKLAPPPLLAPAEANKVPDANDAAVKALANSAQRNYTNQAMGTPGIGVVADTADTPSPFSLTANSSDGNAKLSFKLASPFAKLDSSNKVEAPIQALAVTLQAPLPSVGNETKIGSLDSLVKSTSVEVKYTFVTGTRRFQDENLTEYHKTVWTSQYQSICGDTATALMDYVLDHQIGVPAKTILNKEGLAAAASQGPAAFAAYLKPLSLGRQALLTLMRGYGANPAAECKAGGLVDLQNFITNNTGSYPDYVVKAINTAVNAIIQKMNDDTVAAGVNLADNLTFSPFFAFSLDGTIGYQKYDYFDATTLAGGSVTHAQYKLGVDAAAVLASNFSLDAGYSYQKSYAPGSASGGKQTTSCLNGTGATLSCKTGYFGVPVAKESDLVDVEMRWLTDFAGHRIGLAPQLTYDIVSKVYGVQVPLYLIGDSSNMLTGGIRYDWTSDTKASVVGIFVSTPLCVFSLGSCGSSGGKSTSGSSSGTAGK